MMTAELSVVKEHSSAVSAEDSSNQEMIATSHTRLPFGFAKRHGVLLNHDAEGEFRLSVRTNANPVSVAEVTRLLGRPLPCDLVSSEQFTELLSAVYENDSSTAAQMMQGVEDDLDLASLADSVPETEDLLEQEDDAPIIRLINGLLAEAIKENASDIHIETFEKRLTVRFRVDGILREVVAPKRALAPLLVSRIKVMARLDIAEKRVPQDGRISLRIAGREIDVRVSTIPSSNGERVVMRLLDKKAGRLDLSALGMVERDRTLIDELLHRPHGIILVTGPTGSGKTTTLYAGLSRINSKSKNILTVEDPIEYNLEGIGQTQVNTKADMTFARGLRAILRQDPDVVMVGEIRDLETAEIAVQASLTGHLVLSTLHTNSAVGAVTRLHDMGVEPFLLSSSLIGVLAQRLVRALCPACKAPHQADAAECEVLGVPAASGPTIYRPAGCPECNHSGYRGRIGIFELVSIDEAMRVLIHNQASESELIAHARKTTGSIRDDGCQRVLDGVTSMEEVLRVTQVD